MAPRKPPTNRVDAPAAAPSAAKKTSKQRSKAKAKGDQQALLPQAEESTAPATPADAPAPAPEPAKEETSAAPVAPSPEPVRETEAPPVAPAVQVAPVPVDTPPAAVAPVSAPQTPAPSMLTAGDLESYMSALIVREARRVFGLDFVQEGKRAYVPIESLLKRLATDTAQFAAAVAPFEDRPVAAPAVQAAPPVQVATPKPAAAPAPVQVAAKPAKVPQVAPTPPRQPAKPASKPQAPSTGEAGVTADRAAKILAYLRQRGEGVQPAEVCEALGYESLAARRAANTLEQQGKITIVGHARGVRWTAV